MLLDFITVVNAWRSTHAQAYGGVIPDTGTAYSLTASSTDSAVDLVAASNNEVVVVNAISVTNAGGAAPIAYSIKLGATILALEMRCHHNRHLLHCNTRYQFLKAKL